MLRSASRLRLLLAGCAAAFALGTGLACDRGVTAPREIGPDGRPVGRLVMVVPIGELTATTLVVEVSAPDIIPTMVFNLPVVAGVATGSISIPAGASRLFTVRAFDGSTETHRGTKVLTILAGVNPTASITLTPLAGTVPITASLGSLVITITPLVATARVGDTIRFAATIRDAAAAIIPGPARWATTNTARVTIDTTGLATVLDTGAVIVVATYSTSAGTATFSGTPGLVGPPPPALRNWVGGSGSGSQRNDWAIANNWSPSFVPTATDSVVIGAATFQPNIAIDTFTVRDLTLRTGATLSANCCGSIQLRVMRTVSGEGGTFGTYISLLLRNTSTIRGVLATAITVNGGIGVTLADSARIGNLTVDGVGADFALAGKRLVVTGNVLVNNGGLLHVNAAAETLDVSGTFQITTSAASHFGALGAGTVILRGVTNYFEGYQASGTHTTVFAGAVAQNAYNMDYVNRPANSLQNLVISGTGGVAFQYYSWRVRGTFAVLAGAGGVASPSGYALRIEGPLTTAAGTSVSGANVIALLDASGTANVNGLWSPAYTDFSGTAQTIKAGLGYQNVRLFQSQTIADTVRIAGNLQVDGASTVLNITSPKRVIMGSMTLPNGGTFVLDAASDTLEVRGDLNTQGGGNSLGKLTSGTVILWGTLYGNNYSGTGNNLVKFDNPGTGVQRLSGFDPAGTPVTGLQNFEATGSGNVDVCSNVKIGGSLKLLSAVTMSAACYPYYGLYVTGPITTVVGSTLSSYFVQMGHVSGTNRVAGGWSPGYTDVVFPGDTLKPGLAYQTIRFYASDSLQAGGNYTLTGDLITDGTGVAVGMRGARVTVQGQLNVQNSSRFLMVPGDTMSVGGNMTWNSSAPSAQTGGQISWGGQYLNMGSYVPGGTHKLKVTNAVLQPHINTTDPTLRPFARLEVASPFGVMLDGSIAVTDSFVVSASGPTANVQTSYYYELQTRGPVVSAATSTIAPAYFALNGTTSLAAVAGNFAPGDLRVYQATPGLLRNAPGFHYADIEFFTSYTLVDTLTTTPNAAVYPYTWTGSVTVNNAATVLDFGGKRMRLSGGLDVNTNAILKMVAPGGGDTLMVGDGSGGASGYLYLDGGATANSILTFGTIILRGNTNVTNATIANTHTFVVTDSGLAPGTRTFSLYSGNTLGNVVVRGSSGLTVQYNNNWVVNNFDVQPGPTFRSGYYYYVWHTNGPVTTAAASVVGAAYPYGGIFEIGHTSGTSNVNGVWTPGVTRWMVPGATIKPTLAYQNMEFNASGTFSAVAPTTLTGYLYGTGAGTVISLAGKSVNVGDYFQLASSATLSMTNANDTLMVQNDFQSDNGAVNSNVTAGVIRVRGHVNANRLNPTGTNKIVLDSSGLATTQNLYTYNTPLNRVDVRTNRNVSFQTMTVNDSLNILTPVAYGNTYPYYIYTLNGPITSVASSTTQSGGTYELAHTTGTSLINGTWAPYITRWKVAGATIKPGLAYQNMEFNASGTFSAIAPTVLSGYLYGTGVGTVISMANKSVRVGDYFQLATGATLSMTNPNDTLFVATTFNSDNGSVNSNVNNGVIRVRGNVNANRLNPTGASKLVLDSLVSASTQTVSTGATPLNRVEVRTNRQVDVQSTTTFSDSVSILTPVTFGSSYPYYVLAFVGPVTSVASSTLLGGYLRFQHATAADNLLGNLSTPLEVQLNAPTSSLVPVAPRFSYQYLRIMSTAAMPVGATLKLGPGGASSSGTLYVDATGTLTIPSTSTMHACSDIQIVAPGSISNLGTLKVRVVPSPAVLAQISPPPLTGQVCP